MKKSNYNSDQYNSYSFNNVNNLTQAQINELSTYIGSGCAQIGEISQSDGSGSYSKPIKLG